MINAFLDAMIIDMGMMFVVVVGIILALFEEMTEEPNIELPFVAELITIAIDESDAFIDGSWLKPSSKDKDDDAIDTPEEERMTEFTVGVPVLEYPYKLAFVDAMIDDACAFVVVDDNDAMMTPISVCVSDDDALDESVLSGRKLMLYDKPIACCVIVECM